MTLPGGATGATLTFGVYSDPSFVGMKGVIHLSKPLTHIATGAVVQQTWTVVIGNDGTGSVGPLPFNDDPAFAPVGTTYRLEWQVLSYKDSPSNKVFVLPLAGPTTVDYDLLASADGTQSGTYALPLVTSVNGHAGAVTLTATDVGADAAGAATAAQAAAIVAAATDASSRVAAEVTRADGKYVATTGLDTATAPLVTGSGTTATALRAAFVAADAASSLTYNSDGTVATVTDNGITTTFTYNADGTVATSQRGTGPTRTFSYSGGNLVGVA